MSKVSTHSAILSSKKAFWPFRMRRQCSVTCPSPPTSQWEVGKPVHTQSNMEPQIAKEYITFKSSSVGSHAVVPLKQIEYGIYGDLII